MHDDQFTKRLATRARSSTVIAILLALPVVARGEDPGRRGATSYAPVDSKESFAAVMRRMKADKTGLNKRQADLLAERYDLGDRPAKGTTQFRGKAVQSGTRVKLRPGVTWDQLFAMSPEQVREKDLFPPGFMPLPHPNHAEGGMLFPNPIESRSVPR